MSPDFFTVPYARGGVLRAAAVSERMVVTPAQPLAYARGSLFVVPGRRTTACYRTAKARSRGTFPSLGRSSQPLTPAALSTDRSEEHTSELQSHSFISYAVFCLK